MTMPSPLRNDTSEPLRVAHAALHQAVRSLEDAEQPELAENTRRMLEQVADALTNATQPKNPPKRQTTSKQQPPPEAAQ